MKESCYGVFFDRQVKNSFRENGSETAGNALIEKSRFLFYYYFIIIFKI
jgi:hypothetical protein